MKPNALKGSGIWLSTLICLSPILIGILNYQSLPDRIAVHFGLNFQPDGYAPKGFAVFFIPLLLAAVNFIIWFFLSETPKSENINKALKAIILWWVPVLTVVVQGATLLYALNDFNATWLFPVLIGVTFICLGNYLPKCRQNYVVGVRLPWTLESQENWNRTNRLTGKLFVAGGFILLFIPFLPRASYYFILAVIMLVWLITPVAYSYSLYRKGV